MVAVERRGTVWFYVLLVVMVVVGMSAIGYWISYDLDCRKEWVWTAFPPQYKCKTGF